RLRCGRRRALGLRPAVRHRSAHPGAVAGPGGHRGGGLDQHRARLSRAGSRTDAARLGGGGVVTAPPASGRALSDRTFGFLLTLPALVLFGAIVVYPLIGSLLASLFNQSLVLPGRTFAGLANFQHVLDDQFW